MAGSSCGGAMAARCHRHQADGVCFPYRGDPRQAPQEMVVLPVKFPQFFNVKQRPWRAFLLYMPPWTWTSYFAKAMTMETPFTHADDWENRR
ncbi:hypothetical protein ACQJBY_067875 [Aegilops geniculata]